MSPAMKNKMAAQRYRQSQRDGRDSPDDLDNFRQQYEKQTQNVHQSAILPETGKRLRYTESVDNTLLRNDLDEKRILKVAPTLDYKPEFNLKRELAQQEMEERAPLPQKSMDYSNSYSHHQSLSQIQQNSYPTTSENVFTGTTPLGGQHANMKEEMIKAAHKNSITSEQDKGKFMMSPPVNLHELHKMRRMYGFNIINCEPSPFDPKKNGGVAASYDFSNQNAPFFNANDENGKGDPYMRAIGVSPVRARKL
jgi:hypothetical protein